MRNLILSAMLLLTTQIALGKECEKPVTLLAENTPAPCKGFLFSPAKERELRLLDQDYMELSRLQELTEIQLQLSQDSVNKLEYALDAEKEISDTWKQESYKWSKKYTEEIEANNSNRWIYFGGGALTTILTILLVNSLSK